MRPSRVDTSKPAWVKRKMLSMNNSTSWPWTSRKYSAMVRAPSATRRRTPGGSSIWPNTSAALSSTEPDSPITVSPISMKRSVPSRVRSPTPANTDTPPNWLATRLIISVMSTVLPTPAPPNRPILPPCRYGVSRSMTLMPVGNICALGSSESNAGAGRWISQRSWTSTDGTSRGSPSTLKTWPSVASPTGTEMPGPVLRTAVPRTRPSVGFMAMARTRLSPICWATSAVTTMSSPCTGMVNSRAVLISGSAAGGNSTSTTGPAMATILPSVSWVR